MSAENTIRQITGGIRLYKNGRNSTEAARLVGLVPSTLQWHLRDRGIIRSRSEANRMRHNHEERNKWIVQEYLRTDNVRDVARNLKTHMPDQACGYDRVWLILKEAGVLHRNKSVANRRLHFSSKNRYGRKRLERIHRLVRLVPDNLSLTSRAKAIDAPRTVVKRLEATAYYESAKMMLYHPRQAHLRRSYVIAMAKEYVPSEDIAKVLDLSIDTVERWIRAEGGAL